MYRHRRLIMLGAGVLMVALVVLGVRCFSQAKMREAVQVAQEYMDSKYPHEEMEYRHAWGRRLLVDGPDYMVFFCPVGKSVVVTVKVSHSRSAKDDWDIRDNYISAYFRRQMEDFYEEDVEKIWGGAAALMVGGGVYDGTPADLPLEEKAALHGSTHYLYFNVSRTMNKEEAPDEAARAFEFIRAVQDSGFSPESITFTYDWEKTTKNGNDRFWVDFHDWAAITDVSEVEGRYADRVAKAEAE